MSTRSPIRHARAAPPSLALARIVRSKRTPHGKGEGCPPTRQRAGQAEIKVCAGKNLGGSSIPTSFGIEPIASLKRSTASWDSKTSTM
jgi:hypothetical protein